MSTHASAHPQQRSGSFFASVSTQQDKPGDPIDEWIFASAGMRAARPAPRIREERPGTLSEWRFGDLTLTREVRRAGPHEPWPQQPHHARRHRSVTLLRASNERAPATLIVSPCAGLAIAAREWPQQHSGQDCEVLTLFLPIDAFEGKEPEAALRARCIDTAAGTGALLAHFMRQLAGQLDHLPDDRADLLAVATRALVVACTASSRAHIAPCAPCIASGVVERIRLVVQRHMASPEFGPPQLARLLAMSRSKLYRLLDGDGGVAHFINRERLTQAWRDLTAPGDIVSVHAIANQVGFRDHSTFSRAFRREYGCSPTQARERALLAPPDADYEARPENGMNSPVLGF
jgi:AraC-like DNA-binding protein